MKRVLALILFLLPLSASATTTVSGHIADLSGTSSTHGTFARFYLRGCAGNQPRVNGVALIAPTQGGVFFKDLVADSSGNVSGTLYSTRDSTGLLAGEISCGGSQLSEWYGLVVFVAGKGGPETPIHALNGVALNITTATPISGTPPPAASGAGVCAATQVAFGLGPNTITCDPQWTWDNVNKRMIAGPPKSGFSTWAQGSLDTTSDGVYSFRALNRSDRIAGIASLAENNATDTSLHAVYGIQGTYVSTGTQGGAGVVGQAYANGGIETNPPSELVGVGASAQTITDANVGRIFSVDVDIAHNGNGVVALSHGVNVAIGNNGTGTMVEVANFGVETLQNGGGGTVTNNYGFWTDTQAAAVHNYAFYSADQGSGANNYVYYSAGGRSRLNAGAAQTSSVFDVNNNSTATPAGGVDVVRGLGMGSGLFGATVLRETVQENANPFAHDTWSKTAPAGNGFVEGMLDTGEYDVAHSPNGVLVDEIIFGANGSISFSPDPTSPGLSTTVAFTAPLYKTTTNCKAVGTAANPSVASCSAASAGMFSCSATASTGTCQVNTTAVTANSEIFITQDAADGGASQLNVTCNTANVLNTSKPLLVSKSAGVSFTINLGTVTTNPGCFEFHIIN